MKTSVKQLSDNFKPNNYNIDIEISEDNKSFKGRTTICGIKKGPLSQRFVFHQSGLKIISAKISFFDKNEELQVEVDRINHHEKLQEVRLHTKFKLRNGKYKIELEYSAKVSNIMNGLYPCFYEENGVKKELLATQFESHHAREVFPSIDEPIAKATFDLFLTTLKNQTVIGNTEVKDEVINGFKKTTTFETTPIMSTYLLAFIVGNIKYKEAKTKKGTAVRAYAVPDKVEYVDFALEVAVKCIDFYNEYFGIDYPLDKCDLVALPDFASGAMENWGCITFREQSLLVEPSTTSLASKQYVALVIAHELAHQWFGNLVTMSWWTDLWLNEGFASWMEYFAIDHIFPEWKLWIQFAIDEQYQALSLDALENTHPIEVPVKHPDEIRTIFDAISYSKGASVIHMLHRYVGPNKFKIGINYYLEKHSYGNTTTLDLWNALEIASEKPVKKFMDKWTTSPGFPLVNVNVTEKETTITQERYFTNPTQKDTQNSIWPVALFPSNDNVSDVLKKSSISLKLSDKSLKINMGQTGFYRTSYNPSHLESLGMLIKRGKMSPIDRLGILGDVFETAKAGKSDTSSALYFLNYFKQEDNFAVWDIIAIALGGIKSVMNNELLRKDMKPYTRELVKLQLERLGTEKIKNESHFDQLLRPIILGMASMSDVPEIVKFCNDIFIKISKNPNEAAKYLDPDLRGVVYGTIANNGDKKEYDILLKMHNESSMSEERTTLVSALTGFKQDNLIKQSLSMITSDEVRHQDVSYWIAYSFMNRHSKNLTWDWLKNNWKWLEENLGTDLAFYRMPIYAARSFSEKGFVDEYKKFFMPILTPVMERSYKQGLEILSYQSAWRERDLKSVLNFFKNS